MHWARGPACRELAPTGMKNILTLHKVWMERQPHPDLLEQPPGHDVLVLAPHFGDEAIGPGGAMARRASRMLVASLDRGVFGVVGPFVGGRRLANFARLVCPGRSGKRESAAPRN